MLRVGGMMMLEHINKQQWLLPGYELMCEYYNDQCIGKTGQKIVTSRTMDDPNKYVAIGQTGCSGVSGTVGSYTPTYNMPFMSWAAGMPDLTDRVAYPNFFRTCIPHTAFTYAWLKVAEFCNWTKFAVIMAEEARFRGHFELMKREIRNAGREVALEGQILQPNAQSDDLMRTVRNMRLRVVQMITYETTWRALICSSRSLGMRGLVWLVYGLFNLGFYGILNNPDLSQWGCEKTEIREIADTAIFATTPYWAPKPDIPIFCDRYANLTTTQFTEAYYKNAAALSTDDVIARGGRDYTANLPRDAGAHSADGTCLYAQVFSTMLGLHPEGRKPYSGKTYTLNDLKARSDEVYENINQLLQAANFNGVSGSPFIYACANMPADGSCDADCRNDAGCTGDPNGATIVFQFKKDGAEGDSDGFSPTSEYPQILVYERAVELSATTPEEEALAYDWKAALRFPWGGYWGGAAAGAPDVNTIAGAEGQPCVAGYHVVEGTSYCVPDDMMPKCPWGSVLKGEFCALCPVHTKYDINLQLCLPCEPGTTQLEEGKTSCDFCTRGRASNTTHQECFDCLPGTYTDSAGLSECSACGKGENASQSGMEACEDCPIGAFAGSEGSSECTPCAAGETTRYPGSMDAQACICAPNFYAALSSGCAACPEGSTSELGSTDIEACQCGINTFRQGDQCVACPARSSTRILSGDTAGTLATGSVDISACKCEEGLYMTQEDVCVPCPEGLICPEGAECKSDRCVTESTVYPLLAANYWSTQDKPLDMFKCGNLERCPAGRSPGECGPQLTSRACAHCTDGYKFDGKACVECDTKGAAGTLVFPVLPILLGPVIVCMLYKVSGDQYEKWGTWQVGGMSLVFIVMNHYQIISLLRGVNLVIPVNVDNVYKFFSIVDDVSQIFNPGCAGFSDTSKLMILKSIGPIVIAAVFVITWGASQLIAKRSGVAMLGMEVNRTLNGFFSLMFTFFAGIVAMALMLFKCSTNPVGKSTLNADRSIICYEGEWNGMLAVGLFAVLFWCVGFGGLFAHIVVISPRRFQEPAFRMRWKFLFIKFRPDVHWWALVFVTKGMMLNLGFLAINTGAGQIYWIMTLLTIYATAVMMLQPWRHVPINFADGAGHVCLLLSCSSLAWFIRKDLSPEDMDAMDDDMMNLVIAFSMIIMPVCIGVAVHMVRVKTSGRSASDLTSVDDAMQRYGAAGKEARLEFLKNLGDWDFVFMLQASRAVLTELTNYRCRIGVSASSLSKDLPSMPLPEGHNAFV
jgi:hypothetical protein